MKVYILFKQAFEGNTIEGVFATKDLAFKRKASLDEEYREKYGVEPMANYSVNESLYLVEAHNVINLED